jgi:hypothetical protein
MVVLKGSEQGVIPKTEQDQRHRVPDLRLGNIQVQEPHTLNDRRDRDTDVHGRGRVSADEPQRQARQGTPRQLGDDIAAARKLDLRVLPCVIDGMRQMTAI